MQSFVEAPVSGASCLFYSIEIQQEVDTDKGSYWKTLDQFYSHDGFYLEDGSGARAMVYVKGAKIKHNISSKKLYSRSNELEDLPASLTSALTQNKNKLYNFKLNNSSWLFSKELRFLEWCFYSYDQIYVLGFVQSGLRVREKIKLKLEHFFSARKQIEENEMLQVRFDKNKDGFLDPEELERGARILGLQMQSSPSKESNVVKQKPDVKMIFRHQKGHPFVISNMKEKDLVAEINWISIFKLFGGPVLTLASLVYFFSNIS